MYEEFFNLSGSPFRLAPDPRYFFGSRSHNKAMSYLHYGLRQAEGFIVITGEIGAGKSMLIGHLIDQLDRSNVTAAHLPTPNIEPDALLPHVLSAFRIEAAGAGEAANIEAFEDFLFDELNRGRRVLLIVDEAQDMPAKTLEELRILSNMDYEGTPLFQVFLVGQPDFREVIASADMEQLRQRVIASYHLEPLNREETDKYIRHRLSVAGWTDDPSIDDDAFEKIFAATGGVPRRINKLCSRVFLHCATEEAHAVDGAVVNAVIADLESESLDAPAAAAPKADGRGVADRLPAPSRATSDAAGVPAPEMHGSAEPVKDMGESEIVMPAIGTERDAPEAPETAAMSVFDRLRATRQNARRRASEIAHPDRSPDAPAPATLDEVADAIKAAGEAAGAARPKSAASEFLAPDAANDMGPAADADGENDTMSSLPPVVIDAHGWKRSVAASIDDTRDELKRAHKSVSQLRKQLTEIDRNRAARREKIVASLDRAETLLAELRDAWR